MGGGPTILQTLTDNRNARDWANETIITDGNRHIDRYTKSLDYSDWGRVGMKSKGYGPIYPYESKGRL